jgi:hypothetical protein
VKVASDLDFYLPFHQHAPSLANARRVIYADVDRLSNPNGVGLFNILAFRGVFFGSDFAKSTHFRWFDRYQDWEQFRIEQEEEATQDDRGEEKYYVKLNCYGCSQKDWHTNLLEVYWNRRQRWNAMFNNPTKPTTTEVYHWAMGYEKGNNRFPNIRALTALLIVGNLTKAGLIIMPSSRELGKLISNVKKGARDGMKMFDLIKNNAGKQEICDAFVSLDLALRCEM